MSDVNQTRAMTPERVAAMQRLVEVVPDDIQNTGGVVWTVDGHQVAEEEYKFEQVKLADCNDDLAEFTVAARTFLPDLLEAYAAATQSAATAAQERDALKADCARISAEFGLPPTMAPAEGWVAAQVAAWKRDRDERDRLAAEVATLQDNVAMLNTCVLVVRQRAEQAEAEITRYIEAYKSAHDRAQVAEAEVTRLRGQWEALKADADHFPGAAAAQSLFKRMTDLEARR